MEMFDLYRQLICKEQSVKESSLRSWTFKEFKSNFKKQAVPRIPGGRGGFGFTNVLSEKQLDTLLGTSYIAFGMCIVL